MTLQPERLVLADGKLCIRDKWHPKPRPIADAEPRSLISLRTIADVLDGGVAPAITLDRDAERAADVVGATLRIETSNGNLIYRITGWDEGAMSYTMEWPD